MNQPGEPADDARWRAQAPDGANRAHTPAGSTAGVWGSEIGGLARGTWQIWRQAGLQLLVILLAGWLGYRLCLTLAAWLSGRFAWLGLGVMSVGLMIQIAAVVVGIRTAGRAAGVWDKLPPGVASYGRDAPLLKVLSDVLLPTFAIWTAFGLLDDSINILNISDMVLSGQLALPTGTLQATLNPRGARELLVMATVLLITFAVRMTISQLAERLHRPWLGLLAAVAEAFFSMLLVFGGASLLGNVGLWLRDRQLTWWFTQFGHQVMEWLRSIRPALPELLTSGWQVFTLDIWPVLWNVLLASLLWLALAAVVLGALDISLPGAVTRTRRGRQLEHGWALEVFGGLVQDIEAKILPFFSALRVVLRRGAVFLGCWVLCYAVVAALPSLVVRLAYLIGGVQQGSTWVALEPLLSLAQQAVAEPLRWALLAVGFVLAFGASQPETQPVQPADQSDERRRSRWISVIGVLVCLLLATGLSKAVDLANLDNSRLERAGLGRTLALAPGTTVLVDQVQVGKRVFLGANLSKTPDVFVSVHTLFQVSAATRSTATCFLQQGDAEIAPIRDGSVTLPGSGLQLSTTWVFERPAAGLSDAHLRCYLNEPIVAYQPVADVDLKLVDDQTTVGTIVVADSDVAVIR